MLSKSELGEHWLMSPTGISLSGVLGPGLPGEPLKLKTQKKE